MLIDKYGRRFTYLRISLIDRCNLRCRYCFPINAKFLPMENILTADEIIRLGRIFKDLGITKVRLTGGEPLVRKDFVDIVEGLHSIGFKLNITTNGILLGKYIEHLKGKVEYINISIDTFSPEKYAFITRSTTKFFYTVMENLERALNSGFKMVKINTVVLRGFNDDEIMDFVEFVKDRQVSLRFIEYMPFYGNEWSPHKFVSINEIKSRIEKKYRLEPVKGYSDVSVDFRIPGFKGLVGFIGSISSPFCRTCNRLRLTADGHLKPCLFSPFEKDLRRLLRGGARDEDIKEEIIKAVYNKPFGHPDVDALLSKARENRVMFAIGG